MPIKYENGLMEFTGAGTVLKLDDIFLAAMKNGEKLELKGQELSMEKDTLSIKTEKSLVEIGIPSELFDSIPDINTGFLKNDESESVESNPRIKIDSTLMSTLNAAGYKILTDYVSKNENEFEGREVHFPWDIKIDKGQQYQYNWYGEPQDTFYLSEAESVGMNVLLDVEFSVDDYYNGYPWPKEHKENVPWEKDWNQEARKKIERVFSNQKNINMKPENEKYLENQMKYLGLNGGPIMETLKTEAKEGKFDIATRESFKTGVGEKNMDFSLHFNKVNDMVYLNGYTGKADVNGEQREYTSQANKNYFTAKEMLNLIEGRAVYREGLVNKEGESYNAWNQLKKGEDGKMKMDTFTEGYGFDLGKAVNNLKTDLKFAKGIVGEGEGFDLKKAIDENPVLSGQKTYLENFEKSLAKGNQTALELNDGTSKKVILVEAAPQYKSLNILDENGEKLRIVQHEKYSAGDEFKLKTNDVNKQAIAEGSLDKSIARNLTSLIPDKILNTEVSDKQKVELLSKGNVQLDKATVLTVNPDGRIEVAKMDDKMATSKDLLKVGDVSYKKKTELSESRGVKI
jgi:hypothetical protein